jgi:hypothetical protein
VSTGRRLTRGPSPQELVSSATGRDHSIVTGTNGRRLHHAYCSNEELVATLLVERHPG